MIIASSGKVLGIDVGFCPSRKTTGICVLCWNRDSVTWNCEITTSDNQTRSAAFETLLRSQPEVLAVAIDGPLTPGLSHSTSYRAAEALLSRGKFHRRGKPGQTSSPVGQALHAEATRLASLALKQAQVALASHAPFNIHQRAIVEAFPTSFLGVLCNEDCYPKHRKRRDWTDLLFPLVSGKLNAILSTFLPHRTVTGDWRTRNHDEIAALVCALTATCVVAGRFVLVGSNVDGYIVLPPSNFWGRGRDSAAWAEKMLCTNLESVSRHFPNSIVCEFTADGRVCSSGTISKRPRF